ncbi:MAG TPA: glycosyltransferase family 2 protein [Longimicrobiaceae bacterium]|nr:glycosyltransferase family 2 protein [Longimicrobiaceae bacterium]
MSPMSLIAWILVATPLVVGAYAYAGYPLLLAALARGRGRRPVPAPPEEWPLVSISLPAYNEEAQIRGAVESLLALDYPADRKQILVVSDASTDRTDDIVREYEDRGVELLRMPRRGGKTAGENAAAARLSGDIIVNTDASIRIRRDALKPLVACFTDPEVGVASGRDVSVARIGEDQNAGEAGYVGYEMRVRAMETQVAGIIGASGCFYAIRSHLHRVPLPAHLSRDFASALIARENGYRAVSVDEAVCAVPRTTSLHREYRRKVRTMARGMQTLGHKHHLLNPLRYGAFAWMLLSHKVARWLLPWTVLGGAVGVLLLAVDHPAARLVFALGAVVGLLAAAGWLWPESRPIPRVLAIPAFAVAGNLAAVHAFLRALSPDDDPTWEPTRRDVVLSGS